MDYLNDIQNYIEISADGYAAPDFYLKIYTRHNWVDCIQRKLFGRESNERLVKCKSCDIIAIKHIKDDYKPEIYNYYCRYPIESELSCYEIMIKNIIE